jgi:hypothetical protein
MSRRLRYITFLIVILYIVSTWSFSSKGPIKVNSKVNEKGPMFEVPLKVPNTVKEHSVVNGTILIATPMKNTAESLDGYFDRLLKYDYPKENISLAFLVSDSTVNPNSIF